MRNNEKKIGFSNNLKFEFGYEKSKEKILMKNYLIDLRKFNILQLIKKKNRIFLTITKPCFHQNRATFCSFLYILRSILDSI